MQVETFLFGPVEIAPERVIDFPQGLLGFEGKTRFMLAHEAAKAEPASFTLQSLDDPMLAFQIMDPTALGFHYELALSEAECALLDNPDPADVAVMLILSKNTPAATSPEASAILPNFRAPLVINTQARKGVQKVMDTFRPNITLSNLVSAV